MNKTLQYIPTYIGLLGSLLFSIASNAYLDKDSNNFLSQTKFWGICVTVSLIAGFSQRTKTAKWANGLKILFMLQTVILALVMISQGVFSSRALVMILLSLIVTYNCNPITRTHLYASLTTAITLVLFSSSHYRADWGILFYTIPATLLLIFTLISDQTDLRVTQLAQINQGYSQKKGIIFSIFFANIMIFIFSIALYNLTPQFNMDDIKWKHGVPNSTGSSTPLLNINPLANDFSIKKIRLASSAKGMPAWQSNAMNLFADIAEKMSGYKNQVNHRLTSFVPARILTIKIPLRPILKFIFMIILLLLLYRWIEKTRPVLRIRTLIDYYLFSYTPLAIYHKDGALWVFMALARKSSLHGHTRKPHESAGEFLESLPNAYPLLAPHAKSITETYNQIRYGIQPVKHEQLSQLCHLFQRIHKHMSSV